MKTAKIPCCVRVYLVLIGVIAGWLLSLLLAIWNMTAWALGGLGIIVAWGIVANRYKETLDYWFPSKKKEKKEK